MDKNIAKRACCIGLALGIIILWLFPYLNKDILKSDLAGNPWWAFPYYFTQFILVMLSVIGIIFGGIFGYVDMK